MAGRVPAGPGDWLMADFARTPLGRRAGIVPLVIGRVAAESAGVARPCRGVPAPEHQQQAGRPRFRRPALSLRIERGMWDCGICGHEKPPCLLSAIRSSTGTLKRSAGCGSAIGTRGYSDSVLNSRPCALHEQVDRYTIHVISISVNRVFQQNTFAIYLPIGSCTL